jgi:hypothetical protein
VLLSNAQACENNFFLLFQVEKAILTFFQHAEFKSITRFSVSRKDFSQIVTQIYTEIIYLYDKEYIRICRKNVCMKKVTLQL